MTRWYARSGQVVRRPRTSPASRSSVGSSSSSTGRPSLSVSGTCQFGYCRWVPGWFWARRSPTASARATASRRAGVRARYPCSASTRPPRSRQPAAAPPSGAARPGRELAFMGAAARRLADRASTPSSLAQPDVLAAQVAAVGGRSCVVTDARHAARQRVGGERPPSSRRSNHRIEVPRMPRVAQLVLHPRLDGPRSSPTTMAPRALGLERQDPEHRVVVVPDVRALRGGSALRHPPQPEQAQDVVDPNARRRAAARYGACPGTARSRARPVRPVATAAGTSPGPAG